MSDTIFIAMYHPSLPGTPHVLAPLQAEDLYAAKGWLPVDGSTPAPEALYLTPGVGDLRYAPLGQSARNDVGFYVPPGWGTHWRAARALAQAGTGKARIAVVGDSVSRGFYSSDLNAKGWVGLLRAALQTAYGDGGSGFRPATNSAPFATAKSIVSSAYYATHGFIGLTGTWAVYTGQAGPGLNNGLTTTDTATPATATFTASGTSVSIYTVSSGSNAAWQYQIDGGSFVPVTDGAGFNIQTTTVTGLTAGSHTIVIKYNDAGTKTLYVLGVSGENASGVVVNNHSVYGSTAANVITGAFADASVSADWMGGYKYPADLAVWAMGLNDAAANTTGDAYISRVRRYFQQIRDGATGLDATDLLVVLPHAGKFDNTNYVYQDYAVRLRALCEAYGAAMVDLWALGSGSWNKWSTATYWSNPASPGTAGTDSVHPSDAGHAYVEGVVLPLLTA